METGSRKPNARGRGEQLRAEIVTAACAMLDELGDDEALSLRAVAREVKIAATSVYLHFPDRDSLVLAVMAHFNEQMLDAGRRGEAAQSSAPAKLRGLIHGLANHALKYPGLFKVMHESKVNRVIGMPFKQALGQATVAAVQRCIDEGSATPGDAAVIATDLRAAVTGMLSLRINEPDLPWPPVDQQIDRFLTKLVGLSVPAER
ncbi:TetR/AcrR family transcriptional regulator [Kutzneria buriramensis]|uniref:AcrR family transcriptional regulator n=1 Tax=Kutzneria buriramensis TaxID=1045776 RepID=A0A3E0HG90_9PSEU|nr:TetR/AcrR family transcriptional regulator [Kutzneria buriramensis]REH44738.1 AcrR family transcriptional regulator [Kutzneria buriramensis]